MISGRVRLRRNNGVAISRRGGTLLRGRRGKVFGSFLGGPSATRGSDSALAACLRGSAGEDEPEGQEESVAVLRPVASAAGEKNSGAWRRDVVSQGTSCQRSEMEERKT